MECLVSNKPLNFGVDPDQEPDQEFLKGIFTAAGQGQL